MKTGESSPVFLCIFGEFSREWRTFLDNFPGNPHNKSNSFYFCFLSKESPGPRIDVPPLRANFTKTRLKNPLNGEGYGIGEPFQKNAG